ncbi:unnamed protein product [Adineta steineri]|uniref:NHL repeat containing protein n=2 Tax=Adineta steineri TaxID=433720 RepID=A0A819CPP9_9BILA|nr:unnamed protein product [Adineta steineri]
MTNKKQNNDDFHSINDEITPTSTDQSRISKKFVWITIGVIVILIILSISISLPIIMTKKKNTSRTTTTATAAATTTAATTTTDELSFTSMSNNNYLEWNLNFSIVAGGNGYGDDLNRIGSPGGIYIDDDIQTIYFTRANGYWVIGWKFGEKSGEVVAGGDEKGDKINQLNDPSDVTVDKKNDSLIICDRGNKRVVQWSRQKQIEPKIIIDEIKCNGVTIDDNGDIYVSEGETHSVIRFKQEEAEGRIVAGGHGPGYRTNQLNNPVYIFVDEQYSIYVSDFEYGRVTKWIKNAKKGIIIAKEQIVQSWSSHPCGMAIDRFGNVYVSELDNFQIVRWSEGSKAGYIVMFGGNLELPPSLFSGPTAISLDKQGNLYVVDIYSHRIIKFDVDVN